MLKNIEVRLEIFQEGNFYVALCPDLDVSSFGETLEEAKQSVQEALEAFFEECEIMGTLSIVLEEAGFMQQNGNWLPRQPIFSELVTIG
ncbi:type II toxin-antitoxin system HicB family antitoxin [Planktothrix agardhii]|jgi:predicted RNase H-like HicB family nuclease|nr:type II toxin-antitoxin system HicB family antitoxin [Planktothrix agardhii]OIP67660.1 MAG: hypothetical protein AUK43_18700 [Oscillatoriales cyanobacterium CG2_30_40_61]BBD55375.1 hypothetical protein NIES204_26820 [Planktothrix agardhii NIES-204]HBW57208.1 HicB family protein [Oscillatoriales bacterium UBA8482]MCB8753292.1 HicB family protein [Planktothrix agardhii 1810]MCB8760771.1 HicB family protein [Planktothrix agardhii 1813]